MTHTLLNAGPWKEATVVSAGDVPLAVVKHHDATIGQLPDLLAKGFEAAAAGIEQAGLKATGPGLAIYEGDLDAEFELKVGFPVDHVLDPAVEMDGTWVEAGELPNYKLVIQSVYGDYDKIQDHWATLMERVAEMGLVIGTKAGEVYQTSLGSTEPDSRTDLFLEILQ